MSKRSPVSRRHLLRSAVLGGSGLAVAAVLGCSDEDQPPRVTPAVTERPTGTAAAETGTPAPSPSGTPRWSRLPDAGTLPTPRRDHSLATDGARLYLFGGRDSGPLADFWVYDIAAGQWTEVVTPGPPARFGHNGLFEDGSQRLFVFGGQASGFFNDVWAYDSTAGRWTEVGALPPAPATRYGAAAALDPAGRLVVSHGFTDTGRFDDSWAFSLGEPAWADISPQAGGRPLARCLTRAVWDPAASRFLMFGGQSNPEPFLGDLWSFTSGGWAEITAEPRPAPRNLYSMVWDGERSRAIVFGGRTQSGQVSDVWQLDARTDTWAPLTTQGDPPSPRSSHDAVWLPERRAMLVFGGQDSDGDRNDLWELAF
jgi:hypothetical protein